MQLGFPGGGAFPLQFGIPLHEERAWNGSVARCQCLQQQVIEKHILLLYQTTDRHGQTDWQTLCSKISNNPRLKYS